MNRSKITQPQDNTGNGQPRRYDIDFDGTQAGYPRKNGLHTNSGSDGEEGVWSALLRTAVLKKLLQKSSAGLGFGVALLCLSAVFFCTAMLYLRYDNAAESLFVSRQKNILQDAASQIEHGLDMGSTLANFSRAQAVVDSRRILDSEIMSINVFTNDDRQVVFSTNRDNIGQKPDAVWFTHLASSAPFWRVHKGEYVYLGVPLTNALGERVGGLYLQTRAKGYHLVRKEMLRHSFHFGFLSSLLVLFVGLLICHLAWDLVGSDDDEKKQGDLFVATGQRVAFSRQDEAEIAVGEIRKKLDATPLSIKWVNDNTQKRVVFYLLQLVSFLAVLACIYVFMQFFFQTRNKLESTLSPAIKAKASVVVLTVRDRLVQAGRFGIPFEEMVGVNNYLYGLQHQNPEISYILVTDKGGRVLYETGDAASAFRTDPATGQVKLAEGYHNTYEPVKDLRGRTVGWVQLGVSERFVRQNKGGV